MLLNHPTNIFKLFACITPVVATAVAGIPEQIEDGITRFLTPLSDVESIALQIAQLHEGDRLKQKMVNITDKDA